MRKEICVASETGCLRRVLLHRPGAEMEHLLPRQLGDMLFEDIPWAARMAEEHDAFAAALRSCGAEVLYLSDLLRDVLADNALAAAFADEVLASEVGREEEEISRLRALFLAADAETRAAYAVCGVLPRQVPGRPPRLADYLEIEPSHLLDPLPNLYFMRDPAAVVGRGVVLSAMNTQARQREARLLALIFRHHPALAGLPLLYDNSRCRMPIEGGDVLVLSPQAVAVGCSARTNLHAIDYLARRLLAADAATGVRTVLAVEIPQERAFMHLDTVMTMVDAESFLVYPHVVERVNVVAIMRGAQGGLSYRRCRDIRSALADALGLPDVRLILSGGGDARIAAREQWNDATNTLAVAPGKVIVYNRNTVSNRCLRQAGIETIEIEGSELVRGRGGPRCMSMPLLRDPL